MGRDPDGKKLGRNDPCWCGSNKKFKNCHLDRSAEPPVTRREAYEGFRTSFSDQYCSCAPERKHECKGRIVKAHSLSRRSALGAVTENGHVFSLTPHWPSLFHKDKFEFKTRSAREASTFTGFCEYHDRELFLDLDRNEFDGSKRLSVLSSYRTVCREIFLKKSHIRTSEFARGMDRGRPVEDQQLIQETMAGAIDGVQSALRELTDLQKAFEDSLRASNDDSFSCRNFYFAGQPALVSAGAFNPTHDMSGNFLQDLDLDTYSQNVCFAILPTKDGFWASFLWHRSHTLIDQFIADFEEGYATVGGFYALASAHIENTFFRPSYWAGLSAEMKSIFQFLSVMDLMHRDYNRTREAAKRLSAFHPIKAGTILRA